MGEVSQKKFTLPAYKTTVPTWADSVGTKKNSRKTQSDKMETKTHHEGGITRRKNTQYSKLCAKEERNASLKKVSSILQKAEHERTVDDEQVLGQYSEVVAALKLRWQRRDEAKRRVEEFEEPMNVLEEKCEILAKAIANSEHLVIYTGAGISTAARIPDYRGSNGIWTRLQQGKDIGSHDLTLAEPTYTHMALSELYRYKILKYIVSQNCDGLHLRSGLPRKALSELHGNMYIEVCKNCKPAREYWRLFDVTENTARYSHKTMRRCYICNHELVDTIVHFGERGTLQWPLNWSGACKNADAADTILCLGSSLKVLKRYPWLWQMSKPAKKRPNLYIVNLQWTPKDDCAVLKINGKCDTVMKMVMKYLGIDAPEYSREKDPIFAHATFLCELETHTTTQPSLKQIEEGIKEEKDDEVVKTEKNEVDKLEKDPTMEVETSVKIECNNSIINPIPEQKLAFDLTVSNQEVVESSTESSCDIAKSSIKPSTDGSASKLKPVQNCAPQNLFSIDSILKSSSENNKIVSFQNNLPPNNVQAIMAYYELANTVLQNQMLGYLTGTVYPFQTSFLYPGLHSIINPIPYFTCDFDSLTTSIKNERPAPTKPPQPKTTPRCLFCSKIFNSDSCLYYLRTESIFVKHLQRFSKSQNCNKTLVCVCCDYTTEEDCDSDENTSYAKIKKKPKRLSKLDEEKASRRDSGEIDISSENIDENNISETNKTDYKAKIQPGWFGKGYRKNRRPKKKQ